MGAPSVSETSNFSNALIKSKMPLCSVTKCVDLLFDNDLSYTVIYIQVSSGDAVKVYREIKFINPYYVYRSYNLIIQIKV